MSITKSLYEVQIIVRNKPIQNYTHEGNTYVEGREGSEFELELTNNSSKETLFVPSIDGLSIMDGKPADANSSGYVLKPFEKLSIPGWSLDNKTVAKFVFSSKKKSYAANHITNPSTANVGVIGVLVFSKKENKSNYTFLDWKLPTKYSEPYPWYPPVYPYTHHYKGPTWSSDTLYGGLIGNQSITCSSNMNILRSSAIENGDSSETASASLSVNSQPEQSFSMGTAFGNEDSFTTSSVSFEKDKLLETIVVYYDSRKNLEKMGIVIRNEPVTTKPNPFPGIGCRPPADWMNN